MVRRILARAARRDRREAAGAQVCSKATAGVGRVRCARYGLCPIGSAALLGVVAGAFVVAGAAVELVLAGAA
jgi:hypothetical protein